MDSTSIQQGLYISRPLRILGILILLTALGGCIGGKSKLDEGLPAQNIISENSTAGEDNLSVAENSSINASVPKQNQIRLILRPGELNRSGRLPITLKIINPKLNETVLTVFKPQVGQEWYNQTNVTYTDNNNWTRNYTIKRVGNVSYVLMFVQISDNNTVIKRAAWNISLEAPVGKAK